MRAIAFAYEQHHNININDGNFMDFMFDKNFFAVIMQSVVGWSLIAKSPITDQTE